MENYDPRFCQLPSGICTRCYNLLNRDPSKLDHPVDFSTLQFPKLTRSLGVDNLDDLKNCTCSICQVGRQHPGMKGNKFGGQNKKGDYPLGRPPVYQRLPAPKPFRVCGACWQPLERGKPHPCTVQNKRQQVQKALDKDPVGAEIAASNVIKNKVAAQPGSSSVQLATGGTPLTVQNPQTRKRAVKASYPDTPVPVDAWQKLQAATGVSDNTLNKFIQAHREWHGEKSVESNLRLKLREKSHELGDFFSVLNWPMDSNKKAEREHNAKVDRDIVYVNDIEEFISTLKNKRGYSSRTRFYLKLGIDAGGSSLKVTLNMAKIDDDFSSPPNRSRGLDLGSSKPSMFKESGVKKLQIIALVEKVSESYKNLETLTQLIDLCDLIETDGSTFTFALDYKCGNCLFGLGPASSTYPCPYCDTPSSQFINPNDPTHSGGTLRTLGDIRKEAALYQEAAAKSKSDKKLSSAGYKSCENQPLTSRLPDSTVVLDIYPPPPLHTKLGIVNGLFDTLNGILVAKKKYEFRAEKWSDSLNCTRSQYHGGLFIGNYCDKLLSNLDKLESMLSQAGALTDCLPVVAAFKAFAKAHKACFQMTLEPTYKRDLNDFAEAYVELCLYCRSLKVKCSEEATKVHATMVHVRQFLERKQAKGFNHGLGYYSEEVSESSHYDWDKTWVGGGYKVDIGNPRYGPNAKEAMTKYNSGHI